MAQVHTFGEIKQTIRGLMVNQFWLRKHLSSIIKINKWNSCARPVKTDDIV